LKADNLLSIGSLFINHWSWVMNFRFLLLALLLIFAGCIPTTRQETLLVTLVVDSTERSYPQEFPITVGEFLTSVSIELNPLDEVTPPQFTQITDGLRITVARVQQTEECTQRDIPYGEQRILNEGLQPSEERVVQTGVNGIEEVCNRVTIRDGRRMESFPLRTTTIRSPQDALIYVGPTGQLDPVQVQGTITYISNGNIWLMRGNSSAKRPLTTSADIDGRVLSLTPDGRKILFTRFVLETESDTAFNNLWTMSSLSNADQPILLRPENVLSADWVPNRENTISYSTGEITENAPGWQAYNDLWLAQIDPLSGALLNTREFVARSSGWLYSWWGTEYSWSPDGRYLAWVRADSMGLVDIQTGELDPLLTYPVFSTQQPWSWRASVSWSPDNLLALTTIHGQPIGSEPAETSPAFHVTVAALSGEFTADIVQNAGIWSKPQYSPLRADNTGNIAYLRARDIANSISSTAEYDLVIADRDGSNAVALFPPAGQQGLTADAPYFDWSPRGDQIALIYSGNLWVIDIQSGIANQLTLDRGATRPIWTE